MVKQISRVELSRRNFDETDSAFLLSICNCMKYRRTTSISWEERRMNHYHAFFEFVDYFLWNHVSKWTNNAEVRLIYFLGELSPLLLDFQFITFWLNRSRIIDGFFLAKDFDLIFKLLSFRCIMSYKVQVGVVFVQLFSRGESHFTRAEEKNFVLGQNSEILFNNISKHQSIKLKYKLRDLLIKHALLFFA